MTSLALLRPDKVASLVQIEPVLIYGKLPPAAVLWSLPVSLRFLPQSWRDRGLAEIGGWIPPTCRPPVRLSPEATHSLPMQESVALDSELIDWWRGQ